MTDTDRLKGLIKEAALARASQWDAERKIEELLGRELFGLGNAIDEIAVTIESDSEITEEDVSQILTLPDEEDCLLC